MLFHIQFVSVVRILVWFQLEKLKPQKIKNKTIYGDDDDDDDDYYLFINEPFDFAHFHVCFVITNNLVKQIFH